MKVLLDENIPKKLKYRFSNTLAIVTTTEMDWNGLTNGDLLKKMQTHGFRVLMSFDKNMSHQQNLKKYGITLIVLSSPDTRYESLRLLVPKIEAQLKKPLEAGLIEIT